MDSRVSSILGRNNDGNLIGIGKNKRAYMMYDTTLSSWISVPKSRISGATSFTKLNATHSSGAPAFHNEIGPDHWGGRTNIVLLLSHWILSVLFTKPRTRVTKFTLQY